MDGQIDEAVRSIEAAFADVPRPSDTELLHPSCADDGDLVGLYPYATWRDVPDDVVEREFAALSFLSADGFRCFLPAYMRFALRHRTTGAAAVEATVWSLQPSMYEPELAAFTRSKFVVLDDAQRRAVVDFLEAMADDVDTSGALADWRR